ncbi:AAA family ATPase [Candidatus Woesearchaeota archaeon]|nr:AAA family ATPase [Candidatus Woesearchaeota archaeon]
MIIKSIRLQNIRSYTNQVIELQTGSTLLSGDIGSGKSTILLAIEFALFGVKRKDLSGSALLRHGKKEGEVELKFEIGQKEVIIKRKLKRGKDDIKQEAGYIIIDGIKNEGTHIELKSRILDILGYPKDLITKSKDLVYRYTVYTPQEAMKQILMEDKDIRLDTLRKVFNIDRYKRIRENSQMFIRELKERRKSYEGRIEDLDEKRRMKEEKEEEVCRIDKGIEELTPKLEKAKSELMESKKLIIRTEEGIKRLNELKKEIQLKELSLRNNLERRKRNVKEIEAIEKEMGRIKKELEGKEITDMETVIKGITENERGLRLMRETILEINKKISGFEARKKHSLETKEKVSRIDQCPTCLQEVAEEHKRMIHEKEHKLISELEENIRIHNEQEKDARKKADELSKIQDKLRKEQADIKVLLMKKESIKEKGSKKEEIEEQQKLIKEEIGKINMEKIELNRKIEEEGKIEGEYRKIKENFEKIQENERRMEIEKKGLEVKKEEVGKAERMLREEINRKLETKKILERVSRYQGWLETYFINLMNTMERHMMLRAYSEFNSLFQQWFSTLIEDETLGVRLDDEFTPIIEQDGYETDFINLSGGEKTAVALAYRLALNRVINDIIGDIKTKEILMLDEPTDGFSSEQLDKIRILLEQIGISQIIIVSHESKIESFVDKVIRINKNEHVSEVVC